MWAYETRGGVVLAWEAEGKQAKATSSRTETVIKMTETSKARSHRAPCGADAVAWALVVTEQRNLGRYTTRVIYSGGPRKHHHVQAE